MDDLISRQAAIESIIKQSVVDKTVAIRVLAQLPSAEPEQRWIPCSERLPDKEKKTYWICTDTEQQCECRWTNNIYGVGESDRWGWSIFDIPYYTKVSAWMPLPEPYKAGGNE